MFDLRSIINLNPYSLKKDEKNALYNEAVNDLTTFHYENCLKYKKILDFVKKYKVLTQEAISLRDMEEAISTSYKRDIILSSQLFRSINWGESIKKRKIIATEGKSARKKLAQNLEQHEDNVIKKLYSKPNVFYLLFLEI